MRKTLLFFFFVGLACQAQTPYVLQKSTSLSGNAEVLTIQQPTTGAKIVEFRSAYVDCSAACTVTIERNGNPASTVVQVPTPVNIEDVACKAKAYNTSNAGTGTTLSVVSIPAGGNAIFDLTSIHLRSINDPGQNLTLRTSSITGDVNIVIKFTER